MIRIKKVLEISLQDDSIWSSFRDWLILFAAILDDEYILIQCILKWPNNLYSAVRNMNSFHSCYLLMSHQILSNLYILYSITPLVNQ